MRREEGGRGNLIPVKKRRVAGVYCIDERRKEESLFAVDVEIKPLTGEITIRN